MALPKRTAARGGFKAGIIVAPARLTVVQSGDKCCVLDSKGRRVSRWFPVSMMAACAGPKAKRIGHRMAWRRRCRALAGNVRNEIRYWSSRETDPWLRKVDSLRVSLCIRVKYPRRDKPVRLRHEPRPTHDWASAVERMWHEANNRLVYQSLSPWLKWARNVAKNHNRKRVDHTPEVFRGADGQLSLWQR